MKKPEATRSIVLASGAVAGGALLVDPPPLLAVRKPTSTLSMPRVVDPFSAKIVRWLCRAQRRLARWSRFRYRT
jgi:hypothetical protein